MIGPTRLAWSCNAPGFVVVTRRESVDVLGKLSLRNIRGRTAVGDASVVMENGFDDSVEDHVREETGELSRVVLGMLGDVAPQKPQ